MSQEGRDANIIKATEWESLSPFKDRNDLLYISRKISRLSSVLYVLTRSWPESEVLKIRMRKISIDLLSLLLGGGRESISGQLRLRIFEMLSLLDIASVAHLASGMNWNLLISEYQNLLPLLQNTEPGGEYEDVPSLEDKNSLKDINFNNRSVKDSRMSFIKKQSGGFFFNKGHGAISSKKKSSGGVDEQRKNKIIETVKIRGNVSIKDISSVIREVSEKTIQRDIVGLVSSGVLQKTGERRWSRYSLAS